MASMPSKLDNIARAIGPPQQPQSRTLLVFGGRVSNASEGTIISLIATITNPHIIKAIQFRSSQIIDGGRLVDLLISSDTLTDANAPLRDTHVSGLPKSTIGSPATPAPSRLEVNYPVNRSITYYKLITINTSGLGASLQAMMEIVMMGIR